MKSNTVSNNTAKVCKDRRCDSMPKVLDGEKCRCSFECDLFHKIASTWIEPAARQARRECLRLYDQANKRIWWMPWRQQAMKDVVACDKSRGAGKQALIREFPNGETHPACWVLCTEYIGVWSEPGELKHLSTRRKRNQPRFRK